MRKLRLELDELRIESFATEANSLQRGTVQGRHTDACETDYYVTPCCTYPTVCSNCTDDTCDQYTCCASCDYAPGTCPQTPNTNCEI